MLFDLKWSDRNLQSSLNSKIVTYFQFRESAPEGVLQK